MNKPKKSAKKATQKPAKKAPRFRVGDVWQDSFGDPHRITQTEAEGKYPVRAVQLNVPGMMKEYEFAYTKYGRFVSGQKDRHDLIKKVKQKRKVSP